MKTISQGLLLVVFWSGKKHWYRVSRRKTKSIEDYFSALPDFRYCKAYAFKRGKSKGTGQVQEQIGCFGVKETGEYYAKWD